MDGMDELRSPSLPTSPAASIIVFPLPSMLSVLQLLGTIRCPEKPRAAQVLQRHGAASDGISPPPRRARAAPAALRPIHPLIDEGARRTGAQSVRTPSGARERHEADCTAHVFPGH